MKCTDCGRTIRPVVVVDIDGTLGDYHGHFIRFLRDWLPTWQRSGAMRNDAYDYATEFSDWLGLPKDVYRAAKLAYRQGGWKRTMPVRAGAPGFTAQAVLLGCEVWVCTTRPWQRLDNVDPDTQEWLNRNGITYHHLLYGGDDKFKRLTECVAAERIVMVLEDLPEMIEKGQEQRLRMVQFLSGHAPSVQYRPAITNFEDATVMLRSRTQAWKERHA